MGNCISLIRKKKEPNKAITVALIGLDNAGKTTLCSVLTGEQPDPDIAPTVGFRNVKFSHSNFDVTLFDLGGGKNIRPIWKTYFGEVFGVMYMIDSSSPSRLAEAREMFKDTLEHPQVSGKPVLVLANKVDKDEHMKEVDVVNGLHLEDAVNANNCPSKLVMVSALKGVGSKMDKEIEEGLQWLFDKIRNSLPSLEPRIEEDMRAAKEARDKEREERRARVKKQREEREKAEELERTRLGLTKTEDDEEDIVDGDPFKALDMEKLKKKEQQLKEEKKEKQRRMKELGYGDSMGKSYDDSEISYGSDGRMKTPRSSQAMDMKRFDLSGDPSFRRNDVENSTAAMSLFGRNTRASTLPPLEPLGSLTQDSASGSTDKKKFRKKKKLTDYHLDSRNGGSGYSPKDDPVGRLGLSLHEPGAWNRDADVHDLTPRVAKPKKTRMVVAGRIEEDEEETDSYKDIGGNRMNRYNDVDALRHSQRQAKSRDLYSSKREDRDSSHMNGYDRLPQELNRESSMYRQSLKKISPPNMNRFDDEDDKDEGIEQDDSEENSDVAAERYRAARRANNVNNSKMKDRYSDSKKRNTGSRQYSDEENDSYALHNSLKDTLRFPRDPSDDEEPRDFDKEMDNLRRRSKNDYNSYRNKSYTDTENGGNDGHRSKNARNNDDDSDYGRSRDPPRSIYSPDEDEGSDHKGRASDRSETRRKKKRNLLRSNKLAPSDDEELDSHGRDKFHSPRLVQEHGSRNASDADTPTRNRNSKVTQFHRNISHDSDFGTKWGLAEDLPAIDDNYNVRRLPNFDDSDGDIVF